ncbi:hypothetical protein D3C76_766340 [compost metagenome]
MDISLAPFKPLALISYSYPFITSNLTLSLDKLYAINAPIVITHDNTTKPKNFFTLTPPNTTSIYLYLGKVIIITKAFIMVIFNNNSE